MNTIKTPRSSFIEQIDYDEETQNLDLLFKKGKRYRYKGVTKNKFTRFKHAESKGSYYAKSIKGKYEMRRLMQKGEDA
jgi:lysyl-tRNA synthetase class 2